MSENSASKSPPPRPRRRTAAPPAAGQAAAAQQAANVNTVGQILKAAREKRNFTVEQIAEMLKIRRIYLQAIEDSNWEELPELVYAQGFVRSYAAFLNLDEAAASAQFKREFRGSRRTPELEMPKPIESNQLPDWKIIAAVVVGLLVVYSLWSAATMPSATESVPRLADVKAAEEKVTTEAAADMPLTPITETTTATETVTAPAPETQAASATIPDAQTPPQNGIAYGATTTTRVTITAAQDSWVQVRDRDGQVLFSRVMRPGDTYRVPDGNGTTLTTGNLAGLHFLIDQKGFAPQGTPGTVLRNLSLAPEELAPYMAKLSSAPANTPSDQNNNEPE